MFVAFLIPGAEAQEQDCGPSASGDHKWYRSMAAALQNPEKVRKLVVAAAGLDSLIASGDRLSGLCSLRIHGSDRQRVGQVLNQFKELRYLDLSECRLRLLPEAITGLRELRVLRLNNNNLTALPDSIGRLSKLEHLGLRGNNLAAIPASIGDLALLRELHIDVSEQQALPEALGRLRSLRRLTIQGANIRRIPASLGQLSQLRRLHVDVPHLAALPPSIAQLRHLKELLLFARQGPLQPAGESHTQSIAAPYHSGGNTGPLLDSIGYLSALTDILINDYSLARIPDSWLKLQQLEDLTLDVHPACRIPPAIYELRNLQSARVNGRLTHFVGQTSLFIGAVISRDFFVEFGRTVGGAGILPSEFISLFWTPRGFRYALEIKPSNNFTIGAKLSWLEVAAIFTGSLNLLYYSDFHSETIRLRPEIGIMLFGSHIAYGVNLPLLNSDFEGVSFDSFTIQYNFRISLF